jgi:peroxiredoxin
MTPPDDGSHLVFSNDTACHSRVSFYPPHSTSACNDAQCDFQLIGRFIER